MSDCPHEIWERESDVTADGSCPICLRAENERLNTGMYTMAVEAERLRRDLEIWRRNGGDVLQRAEIEQLKDALATCRELRKYDRAEIEKLRAEVSK